MDFMTIIEVKEDYRKSLIDILEKHGPVRHPAGQNSENRYLILPEQRKHLDRSWIRYRVIRELKCSNF